MLVLSHGTPRSAREPSLARLLLRASSGPLFAPLTLCTPGTTLPVLTPSSACRRPRCTQVAKFESSSFETSQPWLTQDVTGPWLRVRVLSFLDASHVGCARSTIHVAH